MSGESVSPERMGVRMAGAAYEQVRHQRDLLGQALGSLLVALGVVTDAPMTGPELLAHAEMATNHLGSTEASDGR